MSHTRRWTARAAAAATAAVTMTLGAGLPAVAQAPAHHTGGSGSAYALGASGPIPISKISYVSSTGRPADKSLVKLPVNSLLMAHVLRGSARPGMARAAVADITARKLALVASLVTAKCKHGMGSVDLVKARLGKERLAVSPSPNSALKVKLGSLGTASVTLNKQTHNPDGSLTVTAIEIQVPLGPGKTETVSVSSATCNAGKHHTKPAPSQPQDPTASPQPTTSTTSGPSDPQQPSGNAPAPQPVHRDLPVTG